jgi:hypothetical protein
MPTCLRAFLSFTFVSALLLLSGCGADKDVKVEYKPVESPGPAVEVYAIGVTDSEINQYRSMYVSSFFDRTEPLRATVDKLGIGKELTFSPDDASTKLISRSDPIRKLWLDRGATYLIVVQNYPRRVEGNPQAANDARYLELPLDDGRWEGDELLIGVRASGPYCESGTH